MRILVKWHCGEIEEALEEALVAAEMCTFEFVRFGCVLIVAICLLIIIISVSESGYLGCLAILLLAGGKHEQAQKVYDVAKAFHSMTSTSLYMVIPGIRP